MEGEGRGEGQHLLSQRQLQLLGSAIAVSIFSCSTLILWTSDNLIPDSHGFLPVFASGIPVLLQKWKVLTTGIVVPIYLYWGP